MRRRGTLSSAIGIVFLLLVTGCTEKSDGQATPDPGAGSSSETSGLPTTSSEGASPTVEIPPRPRDISLDGLDPCTLFTDPQRTELNANDVDAGTAGGEHYNGMKECVLSVDAREPFYEYNAVAVTFEGVEVWFAGDRNADVELVTIGGFAAAQFTFLDVQDVSCTLAIDVADGQYLMVEMMPVSQFEQAEICQMSGQAAQMALATLQTLR